MKRSQKINVYIYKLLIEKNMDGFTIVEARDAARLFPESPKDINELRKIVYRQILRCIENEWLCCEGSGKKSVTSKRTSSIRSLLNLVNLNHV